MNYWLNLFTGRTWREFQAAGAKVSGFREHNWKRAANVPTPSSRRRETIR